MVYIYDIILNLNKEILEFFEWEETDNIKYIKKVPLVKVNNDFMDNIILNKLNISNDFIEKIKNKTDYYDLKETKNPLVVFTNSNIAIAVQFKNNETYLYSRLLLDEEYEVINIGNKINQMKINYEIISEKDKISNQTREERKIKEILSNEINALYNENKLDKLNYYYYEYFNKINNKKQEVYNELLNSLQTINEKHLKLLEIIKLTNK